MELPLASRRGDRGAGKSMVRGWALPSWSSACSSACRRSYGCRDTRLPMRRMIDAEEDAHVDAYLGDQGGGDHPVNPRMCISSACWTR